MVPSNTTINENQGTNHGTINTQVGSQNFTYNYYGSNGRQVSLGELIQTLKNKYFKQDKLTDMLDGAGPILTLSEGCYVNLALVTSETQSKAESAEQTAHNRNQLLSSWEDIHRPKKTLPLEKLFNPQPSEQAHRSTQAKPIRRVLMLGRAGIGKSTLCQFLAYRWAQVKTVADNSVATTVLNKDSCDAWLNSYDAVFRIELRQLPALYQRYKEAGKPLHLTDVYVHQCLGDCEPEDTTAFKAVIKDLLKDPSKKILRLLDGFDEVAHLYGNAQQDHPLHDLLHELFPPTTPTTQPPQHHDVLTSRPYAVSGLQVEREVENIGLLDSNIPQYIKQYFSKLRVSQEAVGQHLLNQIKSNPNLRGMTPIPINLYLICYLFQHEAEKHPNTPPPQLFNNLTMTQLYQHLVMHLGQRKYQRARQPLSAFSKDWVHTFHDDFRVIARLAFEGLTNTSGLILDWSLQEQLLESLEVPLAKYQQDILSLGLLKTISGTSQHQIRASRYFMHLTFQEFFAALYLVWSLAEYGQATSKNKDQALNFLKNEKYTPRYQVIFWFAAGLVRDATWFNNDDTIQQTALTNLWDKGFLSEPQDITGLGQFHLLAHAFEEGGEPTSLSTSSQDNPINTAWTFIKDAINKTLVGQIIDNKHSRLFKPLFTTLTVCPHLSNNHAQILVKYLQHEDLYVRYNAINALAQLNVTDARTLQRIAERLTDNDEDVRNKAIKALAQLNVTDIHILQRIAERLDDNKWYIRDSAIQALAQLNVTDPHILQRIAERLTDDHRYVRNSAIHALVKLNVTDIHILQRIAERLTDNDWGVRKGANNALARLNITDAHTLQPIAEYLKHDNRFVRNRAIDILAKLHVTDADILQRIAECLTDDKWYVRSKAIDALAQLNVTDPHILQRIAERLTDNNENIRSSAINAFAQLNVTAPHILQRIAERLTDDDWNVRSSAINAFAQLNVTDPHILQLIAEYSQHEDLDVCNSAIYALTQLHVTDPQILQRIAERLTDDKWYVRKSAINALAQLNITDTHILQRIAERLTDDNEYIRYSAIHALAQLHVTDAHTLQLIAEYLKHDDPDVRSSAFNALVKLNVTDPHILQRIAERLTDDKWYVRKSAINALALLNGTDPHILQLIAERLTDNYEDVRSSAINALAQLNITDIHILQRIVERLADDNWRVRKKTIHALAHLHVTDAHTLQLIAEYLKHDDPDVRSSAINALAQLNITDIHILQRIVERLTDNDRHVRQSAIDALAQLNVKDAHILQRIAERLADNEWNVSQSAINALAQLNGTDTHILQLIAEYLMNEAPLVRISAINALAQLHGTDTYILQRIAQRLTDNNRHVRDIAVEALNRLQPHLTIECLLPLWDKRLANKSKGALSATTAHRLMATWIDKHLNTQTNCHLASNASLLKISRLFAKWIFDWLQLPLLIDENQHTLNMITTESADMLIIPFPNHPLGQSAFKLCKQALELESFINPVVPFPGHSHSHTQHLKPEHRFNALQQHLEHYLNTNEDFDFDYVLQNILYTYASLFELKPELWQSIIDSVLTHPANHLFTKNPILHHTYKTTPIQTLMEARNKSVDDLTAKGQEYSSKAKLDKAIQQYEQAVMTDPNHFKPYYNLASLYQAKAQRVAAAEAPQYCELAEHSFNQALKLKAISKLYAKYGQFLYIQQRYEKALPLLTQAIKTRLRVTDTDLSYHSLELPTLDTILQNWLKNHKTLSINSAQLAYYLKYRCYEALKQTQQQAAWLNQWAEWLNTSSNKDSESWSDSSSDSNEEDELSISQHLLTTCQKEHTATPIHTTAFSDTTETNDESPINSQTQPLENQLSKTEESLTKTQPTLQTTTEISSTEAVIHKHWQCIITTSLRHSAGSFNLHTLPSTPLPLPSPAPTKPPHKTISDNEEIKTQNTDTPSSSL